MPRRKPRTASRLTAMFAVALITLSACAGAATPAPPTAAPATAAPPTAAPPTAAPVTPAPATAAPATEAPATEAPATEAPATAAPGTEAPGTEAPASEAPATEAPTPPPATPTPVPTEPPTIPPNATRIDFWSWVPGIQTQVNEFNASHPDIFVVYDLKGAGNAEYANLNTVLQANAGVPDVVQIEFQWLPSYIASDDLTDLTAYGANDIKDKFVPWTWSQVSSGSGVYAYPQDAGPMVQMCNQSLLDKYSIKAPTTWDEFTKAAADMHAADKNVFLSNFTADQGWFFGMLWQSGARPFTLDGTNITIDFTSPEAMRVAKLWGDLLDSGNLSPTDTYTSEWNSALASQNVACWQSGAWGPEVVEPAAPDLAGKWRMTLMPQWVAGDKVNGNYGGSTIAVTKASAHPEQAATFDQWLNTDPAATLELANGTAGLFPVTNQTTSDPAWADKTYDYWGGEKIHQVTSKASEQVDVSFQWSPLTGFVYTTYAAELTKVRNGEITYEQLMADMQTLTTAYATDQGYTVLPAPTP